MQPRNPYGQCVQSAEAPSGLRRRQDPATQACESAEELAFETVAERLRAKETRASTLDALEARPGSIPRELALAAAPALVDVAVEIG